MADKNTRQEIAFAMREWIKDMKSGMKGDNSEWTRGQRQMLTLIDEMSDAIYDGRISDIAQVGK